MGEVVADVVRCVMMLVVAGILGRITGELVVFLVFSAR